MFSVYRAAAASGTNSFSKLTFNAVDFNVRWITAHIYQHFTAPVNGIYHFSANIYVGVLSGNDMGLSLYKNGTEITHIHTGEVLSVPTIDEWSALFSLVAGDYIEVYFNATFGVMLYCTFL